MAAPVAITISDSSSNRDAVTELQDHFARVPRWEYEKFLGKGSYGAVVLVKKLHTSGQIERLAIKRSISEQGDESLRREITWIKRLRGAEHIVKTIAARDDINDPSRDDSNSPGGNNGGNNPNARTGRRRRFRPRLRLRAWFNRLRPMPADSLLIGLTGPVLAMEFLENGTWGQIMNRILREDIHLPNRMLWSIFLCLVRACIGLAYPIGAAEGERTRLETIPADGRAPSTVSHNDINIGNIMFGDQDGRFVEHSLVPVAKFIDLGSITEKEGGVADNVLKIGTRMVDIIVRRQSQGILRNRNAVMHNGIVTHAWPILPRPPAPPRAAPAPAPSALPEITPAPPVPAVPAPPPANAQMPYPLLDAELRDLLARCMAQQPADRPSLPALLRTVQDAVSTRTAAWYSFPPPDDRRETADGIRDFVRRAVYDAPEQPAGNGRLVLGTFLGPPAWFW